MTTTSVTVQLDPIALREATVQAVMGVLTPELRDKIIQSAIAALLHPSTNSWDKGRSPIQEAFDNAVVVVAKEVARDVVKKDAKLMERLGELMAQTAEKLLNQDTEEWAKRCADAFVESIRRQER